MILSQTKSDSSCETQDSCCDFRTLFVTPADSICGVKTNISTKTGRKAYVKRFISQTKQITVLRYAFPSTLTSKRCFSAYLGCSKVHSYGSQNSNFVEN